MELIVRFSYEDNQMVTRLKFHAAMRDQEPVGSFDHYHADAMREMQVAKRCSGGQIFIRDDMVTCQPHFFGNLHSEGFGSWFLFIAEFQ